MDKFNFLSRFEQFSKAIVGKIFNFHVWVFFIYDPKKIIYYKNLTIFQNKSVGVILRLSFGTFPKSI